MHYPDFMIDVETMGTRPDRNQMIQLAVIPFNHKTGEVSSRVFNRCLEPSEFRNIDKTTMEWWLKDEGRKAVLNRINSRLDPVREVLLAFTKFVIDTPRETPAVFWGNSPGFDWFFLSGYAKDYAVTFPFNYYNQRELKSYVCGMTGLDWENVKKPERQFAHDALYDCAYQIAIIKLNQVNDKETMADLRKTIHVLKQANVPMPKRVEFDPLNILDDDLPF
jgi:DNA polymerase III epsilon subunit-like protein